MITNSNEENQSDDVTLVITTIGSARGATNNVFSQGEKRETERERERRKRERKTEKGRGRKIKGKCE